MDQISDMLTRVRNAQMAGHASVSIHASKLKMAIAEVLAKENFVGAVSKQKDPEKSVGEEICITLRYEGDDALRSKPTIAGIRRMSKPGKRYYVGKDAIRAVKNGYGIAVVSTSQGVMTGSDARKKGLGGELLCEVW